MRKAILIFVLLATVMTSLISCATYRNSDRSGCKATQGYVGYGH